MPETLRGVDPSRLERSCDAPNSIRFGAAAPGIERAAVRLSTCAFEPHRHDTYAIGITTAGVQTFRYRGARRICLPGQLHVLHPDETHDGGAATDDGFAYRILYIAPELVRDALGGGSLPFVADPVAASPAAAAAVAPLLADIDEPIGEIARVGVAVAVADTLRRLGERGGEQATRVDIRAVQLAHDYLAAHAAEQTPASTLERLTGLDRFTLTRQFRRAFGTTPDRYRTLRRLDLARRAIERGRPLVEVATCSGFADQSHLTRQFKRAFGLTPARWAAVTAAANR